MRALLRSPGPRQFIPVCTENSVRIDYVTESPNLSGDDRPVLPLLVPVRLAVSSRRVDLRQRTLRSDIN
jgi:hypothetical protein